MNLTSREKEVLKYLCDGCTYEEIAKILFISVAGVRYHIHNILQKYSLKDKAQLVSYAFNNRHIM